MLTLESRVSKHRPKQTWCGTTAGGIPPEVSMVISALEVVGSSMSDRRALKRFHYRVVARLRLFSDAPALAPRILYTRDVNRRGLGFVTSHRLPLGYGGVIELPNREGEPVNVHCTLLRCREAAPGWYEGSIYFNREQMYFEE